MQNQNNQIINDEIYQIIANAYNCAMDRKQALYDNEIIALGTRDDDKENNGATDNSIPKFLHKLKNYYVDKFSDDLNKLNGVVGSYLKIINEGTKEIDNEAILRDLSELSNYRKKLMIEGRKSFDYNGIMLAESAFEGLNSIKGPSISKDDLQKIPAERSAYWPPEYSERITKMEVKVKGFLEFYNGFANNCQNHLNKLEDFKQSELYKEIVSTVKQNEQGKHTKALTDSRNQQKNNERFPKYF